MRCARCDRLAIPQAVGRTPDGQLVFGWCLDCMTEAECRRIHVAGGRRRLRRPRPRRPRRVATVEERRATGLALVALPLLLWGVTFVAVGTWKAWRVAPQPFGTGAPVVLIVGGAGLAVAGLVLAGVAFARASWFWKTLEGLLFACAVLALMLGVVQYDPKRAPWMVALAGFAIALSGLVHQRRRFALGPARPREAPGELL